MCFSVLVFAAYIALSASKQYKLGLFMGELSRIGVAIDSDLLDKFVSRKTGKPFAAHLVLGEKGKVAFEFPER